jgi:hypothetical protein
MKSKGRDRVFIALCESEGLPTPQPEFKFHATRKWRIDWFFESGEKKVALEVEGGVWIGGRHTRGKGFIGDMEKYNALTVQGIALIRIQPKDLLCIRTLHLIRQTLGVI